MIILFGVSLSIVFLVGYGAIRYEQNKTVENMVRLNIEKEKLIRRETYHE